MNIEPFIPFRQARDVGGIVNATFAFLRQHFVPLCRSMIFLAGPFLILSAILTISTQFSFSFPTPEQQLEDPFAALEGIFTPTYFLGIIFSLVGTIVLFAVVYAYVMLYVDHDGFTPEVGDVWEYIRDHMVPFITTPIGFFVIFVLMLLLNIIPCLGTIAFLVGGIYLFVVFSILYTARLQEDISFFEGIGRCRSLIQGYFWPTLGLLLMVYIITFLLSMLLSMPYTFIVWTSMFNSLSGEETTQIPLWLSVLATLSAVVASLLNAIPVVATSLQYFNLVELKEAPGLSERIDQINL